METRKNMEITNSTLRLEGGELLDVLQCASRLVGTTSPNGIPPYIETAPNGDFRITDLPFAEKELINSFYVVKAIAWCVRSSLSAALEYTRNMSRQELLDYLGVKDSPGASYCELAALSVKATMISIGAALREIDQWRGMQASPFITSTIRI